MNGRKGKIVYSSSIFMYYAGKKKGGGVVMCDKEKKIKREIHV
jgi:hypothetical protein